MKNFTKNLYRARKSYVESFNTEWSALRGDKAVVTTLLGMSLILLVVYTYIYSKETVREIPVAVLNKDAGKVSRDYIRMFDENEAVKVVEGYMDLTSAQKDFYSGKVKGILLIPRHFQENLRLGRTANVSVYTDASNMLFYKQVMAAAKTANAYFNTGIRVKKSMARGLSKNSALQYNVPVQVVSQSLFNPASGYATYLIPTVTALVLQLVILMSIGILGGSRREKNKVKSHFPRLLHRGGTIPVLLGKASIYSLIFAVILPLQVGIIYSIFSIPVRSSVAILYLFSLPYFFSAVFMGIVFSSFFKKREDAIVFLVLTSIPTLMLSGLSFPMESMPSAYKLLSQALPSTHGIQGFVKLTQMKADFSEVYSDWLHLWTLCVIYFIGASISLKLRAKSENKRLKKESLA
ncbi:MAG: ABC transporter permease [Salinimicrobium sp.]